MVTWHSLLHHRVFLFLAAFLSLFSPINAANLDDPFTVKRGATSAGGACLQKEYDALKNAFTEAVDLARAARNTLEIVKISQQNWVFGDKSARSGALQAVFGIKTSGFFSSISQSDLARLNQIQSRARCDSTVESS